jgi:Tape measure protein
MANNTISILIQAKDSASAELSKVSQEVSNLGNKADEADPKTGRFESTLGTLGSRLRFVAETFAIYKLGQSIADFASSAVSASGELEQTNMSFQSLIGNVQQANELFGQLVQYANVTPFQAKDVTAAAKQLLAFGQTAEQVTTTVKQLGDVTSAGGGDLQALSLVTGQIFAQGKLRAQDMYQVINDGGAGLIKIMADGVGGMQNLTKEFDTGGIPAQQYFDAINKATANGGFAFEGAQKQADTFNGRLSTLKDSATQFGEALIGVHTDPRLGLQVQPGGLFDRMKNSIKGVSQALSDWEPAVQRAVPQFLTDLSQLAHTVADFVEPSLAALGNTLATRCSVASC